jgi:hypothetical protein
VIGYQGVVEIREVFVGFTVISDDVGEVVEEGSGGGFAGGVVVEEEIDFSVGLGGDVGFGTFVARKGI